MQINPDLESVNVAQFDLETVLTYASQVKSKDNRLLYNYDDTVISPSAVVEVEAVRRVAMEVSPHGLLMATAPVGLINGIRFECKTRRSPTISGGLDKLLKEVLDGKTVIVLSISRARSVDIGNAFDVDINYQFRYAVI